MAEEFSTDGMLDMYLFENGQLLEQLQEIGRASCRERVCA